MPIQLYIPYESVQSAPFSCLSADARYRAFQQLEYECIAQRFRAIMRLTSHFYDTKKSLI